MAETNGIKHAWKVTHGGSYTAEYRAWHGMISRCNDINNPDYGQRGISVCERWRNSFPEFLIDMGNRPSPEHSVERKDVNGNYEPGNCVWATDKDQMRNRRDTNYVMFHGERRKLVELAEEQGLQVVTVRARLARGKSPEEAFGTPVTHAHRIVYRGVSERISVLAKRFGLHRHTVKKRIEKGWTVEKALETPKGE